jgi:hypothetical protein
MYEEEKGEEAGVGQENNKIECGRLGQSCGMIRSAFHSNKASQLLLSLSPLINISNNMADPQPTGICHRCTQLADRSVRIELDEETLRLTY